MKILHLFRTSGDTRALATAAAQAKTHEVSLLLLHDAVLDDVSFAGPLYACRDDAAARNGRGHAHLVDYDDIVRLIFAHDRVISW